MVTLGIDRSIDYAAAERLQLQARHSQIERVAIGLLEPRRPDQVRVAP